MSKAVLVTGASGFVGSALCAEFFGRNIAVAPVKRVHIATEDIVVSEIDGSTDWSFALRQCSTVVHLAARVHVMQDVSVDPLGEYRRINVHGTLNLARQAAAAGVRRFVFVSSVKVNGESTAAGQCFTAVDVPAPQDPYGISKMEAEQGLRQIAAESGMEVVIIRPPLVYGLGVKANFAALMRAVQRGWPLPLGAVHNQRSLVALGNLVDFIITCTTHPAAANQTFLVSDGQDLSTSDLVRGMAQAAGVPCRLLPVPLWALRLAGRMLGKGDAIDRVCGNLQVDISKARTLLGWAPPVSVQEGLRKAVGIEGSNSQ
jgi:nucleoside-diphosphate-sugar epimerase